MLLKTKKKKKIINSGQKHYRTKITFNFHQWTKQILTWCDSYQISILNLIYRNLNRLRKIKINIHFQAFSFFLINIQRNCTSFTFSRSLNWNKRLTINEHRDLIRGSRDKRNKKIKLPLTIRLDCSCSVSILNCLCWLSILNYLLKDILHDWTAHVQFHNSELPVRRSFAQLDCSCSLSILNCLLKDLLHDIGSDRTRIRTRILSWIFWTQNDNVAELEFLLWTLLLTSDCKYPMIKKKLCKHL